MVGFNFLIAFLPSKPAPIAINAIGEVSEPILLIVLYIIFGNVISKYDKIIPPSILSIIGFVQIPFTAFLRFLPSSFSLISGDSNVSTITANMLYRGTEPSIISGAILAFPLIFCKSAIPSMAALPRYAPWTNSPTIFLSEAFFFLQKSFASVQITVMHIMVESAQYRTYLPSNVFLISQSIILRSKRHGSVTLKLNLFDTFIYSSFNIPVLLKK